MVSGVSGVSGLDIFTPELICGSIKFWLVFSTFFSLALILNVVANFGRGGGGGGWLFFSLTFTLAVSRCGSVTRVKTEQYCRCGTTAARWQV